jgi:hypothetical protein
MWYVCDEEGIIAEFDNLEGAQDFAVEYGEEDTWITSDDDGPEDWDYNEDEGYDPYAGCYTWDC